MGDTAEIKQYYANHRWFVIGGLGAVGAAALAYLQLRKGSQPLSITVAAPVGASSGIASGFAPSDLLAGYQAGAAASAAGIGQAVGLGQGGLDLASATLASESQTSQTLAGSQSSMGGSLADVLREIFAQQPNTIPVAAQPWGMVPPQPTPITLPTPTPTPITLPTPTRRTGTVKAGDTLSSFARRYGTTPRLVLRATAPKYNLSDAAGSSLSQPIRPGWVLNLP